MPDPGLIRGPAVSIRAVSQVNVLLGKGALTQCPTANHSIEPGADPGDLPGNHGLRTTPVEEVNLDQT